MTSPSPVLSLPEKLTVLCYDERGRRRFSASNLVNACLMSGLLCEMVWDGAVRVAAGRLDAVPGRKPAKDLPAAVFDDVARREESPAAWTRISRPFWPDLRDRIREDLIGRGILASERGHRLGILPARRIVPFPGLRQALAGEIMAALASLDSADPRTLALAFIVDCAEISFSVYPRPELPRCKAAARTVLGLLSDERSESPAIRAVAPLLDGLRKERNRFDSDANMT